MTISAEDFFWLVCNKVPNELIYPYYGKIGQFRFIFEAIFKGFDRISVFIDNKEYTVTRDFDGCSMWIYSWFTQPISEIDEMKLRLSL